MSIPVDIPENIPQPPAIRWSIGGLPNLSKNITDRLNHLGVRIRTGPEDTDQVDPGAECMIPYDELTNADASLVAELAFNDFLARRFPDRYLRLVRDECDVNEDGFSDDFDWEEFQGRLRDGEVPPLNNGASGMVQTRVTNVFPTPDVSYIYSIDTDLESTIEKVGAFHFIFSTNAPVETLSLHLPEGVDPDSVDLISEKVDGVVYLWVSYRFPHGFELDHGEILLRVSKSPDDDNQLLYLYLEEGALLDRGLSPYNVTNLTEVSVNLYPEAFIPSITTSGAAYVAASEQRSKLSRIFVDSKNVRDKALSDLEINERRKGRGVGRQVRY